MKLKKKWVKGNVKHYIFATGKIRKNRSCFRVYLGNAMTEKTTFHGSPTNRTNCVTYFQYGGPDPPLKWDLRFWDKYFES